MAQTPTTWLGRTLVNPDTTGFQGEQKIIGLSNGNILVVFSDDSATSPSAGRDITGVIYDAEGTIVRTAFQVNTLAAVDTEQTPSIAATNDGGFIMAYEDNNASGTSLRAQRYDSGGNSTDSVTVLLDPGTVVLNNPVVAVNQADNSFFVTYEHNDSGNNTIRGRKFDANLDLVGAEVTLRTDEDPTNTGLDGDPLRNDTAVLTNGTYVTVFQEGDVFNNANDTGIEVRLSTAAGLNSSNLAVTAANGIQDSNARVTSLSDGGFVVTWLENEGSGASLNNNIKYRVYEANGTARTGVLTAVDTANNHSGHDVIGLEDGTFFIIWEDNTFGELEGQLYAGATGATIGSQINVETLDTPNDPNLGTTTDGRILVTYQTLAGGNNVHYEIFDPRDITITADPGDGQVTAGLNGSRLIGSSSSESLLGQGGNDLIIYPQGTTGSSNVDTIDGGGGTNTFEITTLATKRLVDLNAGVFAIGDINSATPIPVSDIRGTLVNIQNVTVAGAQDIRGNAGVNVITATGNFANAIEGLGGADSIFAGAGNDVIVGGTEADTMRGEAGDDDYFVDNALDAVLEAVANGLNDRVYSSVTYSLALGQEIERLSTTSQGGVGAIDLTGNEFVQLITGNAGVNVLNGRGGADTMFGFGGNDDYFVDDAGDVIGSENVGLGLSDRVFASASYVLTAGQEIERLSTTSQAGVGAIDLTGNEFGQFVIGNAGNNVLNGGGGIDTMAGNAGNDDYFVDNVGDIINSEGAANGANDRVFASVSYSLAAGLGIERLSTTAQGGVGAIDLTGNEFGQQIVGNAGVNVIVGGAGLDTMSGHGGDDDYFVDNIGDVITSENAGNGVNDRVFSSVSYDLATNQAIERLSTTSQAGVSAINLTGSDFGQLVVGNNGNNQLNGLGGADNIAGNGGNDEINGGLGNDSLTGGANLDTFVFNTVLNAATNVDAITDYNVAQDQFQLDNAVFAGLGNGPLAGTAFTIGAAATNGNHRIIYDDVLGTLSFDADGDGVGGAVRFATLSSALALNAGEFFVV